MQRTTTLAIDRCSCRSYRRYFYYIYKYCILTLPCLPQSYICINFKIVSRLASTSKFFFQIYAQLLYKIYERKLSLLFCVREASAQCYSVLFLVRQVLEKQLKRLKLMCIFRLLRHSLKKK